MPFQVRTLVTGPWRENCYLVSDAANRAVIIDPGDGAAEISSLIETSQLDPCAIVATHGHHDHVGAAASLGQRYGIPFLLHDADARLLSRTNFYRKLFDKAKAVGIPAVDGALEDAMELEFGELRFRVIHTPGHTPGGVSFAIEDSLFSGDILLKGRVGRVDLPGGDRDALAASLRVIAQLEPRTSIFPGHGEATTISAELAENSELRELLQ